MKNLMIYFSPTHSFKNPYPLPAIVNDAETLVKVQIDNAFSLGWKKKDILLFTNFDYQYGGIKAIVVKDSEFSKRDIEFLRQKPHLSKFVVITKLFEKGLIEDDIYWSHDFDAFQLHPIKESELELEKSDIGSVNSFPGGLTSWNCGSFFFKLGAKDIFVRALELMYKDNIYEETSLDRLTKYDESIKKRIKELNFRYNLKRFQFEKRYHESKKPIKVVYFHPYYVIDKLKGTRLLDKFMGENELQVRLITPSLTKIFKSHGIS